MKKIFLIALFTGIACLSVNAQKTVPVILKKTTVPPPPPPPPPPVPAAEPVYTLTAVKATIQTGNDNKEFGAGITVSLYEKPTFIMLYQLPGSDVFRNELAVNSTVDLGLDKRSDRSIEKFKLSNLQQTGVKLSIYYNPQFFLDAWKIENVKVTLEFKDQNGNLHPVYGNKTIVFNTAKGILTNEYHALTCFTDGNFNPLTAIITKSQN